MNLKKKINAEYLWFPFYFDLITTVLVSQQSIPGFSLLNMILSVPNDSSIFMLKISAFYTHYPL